MEKVLERNLVPRPSVLYELFVCCVAKSFVDFQRAKVLTQLAPPPLGKIRTDTSVGRSARMV
jgi:hypothetical protein